jgi:hypothetical protein
MSDTGDFISEEDLLTFEGFLKYQGVPATATPEELEISRGLFEESLRARESSPKVGLMKLRRMPGEEKYAVGIQDGADLWLTMWVRYSRKGEVFIMYPRGDRDWDAHVSYHSDGTLHQKSYGSVGLSLQRQPLKGFRGSEPLGLYAGHGKGSGAVCDRQVFDGVVVVEPRILGPKDGSVGFDLIEPGYEATWERDVAPRFYFGNVYKREVFRQNGRLSVAITIQR